MLTGRQTPSESATFISCIFRNLILSGYSGGAIYFSGYSQATLTVTNCVFEHCEVSISSGDGAGGGAIYCGGVSTVRISSSTFLSCMCNTTNNSDGGGIKLYRTSDPLVSQCTFLSCRVSDDGAGLSVWNDTCDEDMLICEGCRFINGYATGSSDPFGGGVMMWYNTHILRCSDILFAHNYAELGGAYATDYNKNEPNYPLRFCFFHGNTGDSGNDVCFESISSSYDTHYFLHCCSTTISYRIQRWHDNDDYGN